MDNAETFPERLATGIVSLILPNRRIELVIGDIIYEDRVCHAIVRLAAAKVRTKPRKPKLFENVNHFLLFATLSILDAPQRHAQEFAQG